MSDQDKIFSNSSSEQSMESDPTGNTQKSFDQVFIPIAYEDQTPKILARDARDYLRNSCVPSKTCAKSYVKIFFPFWSWLKIYQMSWLPDDIICGITVAIMQIPQAMGYALLARLPPMAGLYMSFFPPLMYCLFGTSRHLSIGAIAVISMMTGNVVDRLSVSSPMSTATMMMMMSGSNNATVMNSLPIDPWAGVRVASTLGFTVGLVQVILCVFHLGFITSFLSDAFISGYTTATALFVLTSQIPDIFGLTLKRYYGPFNIVYTYIEIVTNLHRTNFVTLAVSICSMALIIGMKEYLEPFYKNKIKKTKLFRNVQIPIPTELFVIILGTLISYCFQLNQQHKVKIVNTIGQGFRQPEIPAFTLIPSLLKDAVIIAIVSFAICISLAKTYAKKMNYTVDPNQELSAYGLSNIFGSFFSSYPCAASLARTSVFVNVGGRTQLASAVSSIFLLIIILRIGTLFEPLPKACLASIIAVALKSLFLQVKDIVTIGRVTKLESLVWIVTFSSTALLDVDYGLVVGVLTSLIVTIIRQFRPRTTILGQYERSEVMKKTRRFTHVDEIPRIKIFRFESPLIYFNADFFRDSLLQEIRYSSKMEEKCSVDEMASAPSITDVIVDCSSINQIDYSGAKIFLQTLKELNDQNYKIYLTNLRYYNYELLEKLNIHQTCSVIITATIHDAVHHIQQRSNEQDQQALLAKSEQ